MSSPAKIAVIYYSTYGHITKLTESVVEGAKSTGAQVDVFQIPETLSEEILAKQHAIPRPDYPVITGDKLEEYDGFIFGFPTRYGRAPAQVSAFFDSTGKQWASGKLVGKCATVYTSVASQHGGLETTALTTMPFFIHHGIAYVPPGYSHPELTKLDEIIGGSAYGAGTVAGGDGSRQPIQSDLNVAKHQGSYFAGFVNNLVAGKAKLAGATQHTTTAAEALPASAVAGGAATATNGTPGSEGYVVDHDKFVSAATPTTHATSGPAAGAAQPASAANPDTTTSAAPAASGAAAAAPAATATKAEQQTPATQQNKQAKKTSIWARCCGNSKDYAQ